MVQLLLKHGANIEAKNKYGKTPLFAAARSGSNRVVQLLLDKGAEKNFDIEEIREKSWIVLLNTHVDAT